MVKNDKQDYLTYAEVWDAIQSAFCNLNLDEVTALSYVIVRVTDIEESCLLIQVEKLESKNSSASKRDVEIVRFSGYLNKVMKKVGKLAQNEGIHWWKETSKGRNSVWCFKMLWDEDEDE